MTALLLFLFLQSAPDIDKIFATFQKPESPGCAVAVMRDGAVIFKKGYGMADLEHDIPVTPSSVFHVASVSKQFTAASIVLLAQQGKLSLDDPARKYVTELPDFGTPITIRQLIHHTSGLRDQWDLLGMAGWRYSLDLITDDDVMELVARQKELNFRPGDRHLYCNTGYTLLAQIVKRVSGKSLREFTSENIFGPLGMKSTAFRDDHAIVVKQQALGYSPRDGKFRLHVTNFDTVGATSLLTTVEDMALWEANFLNPKVGGPEFVRQMQERGKLNDGTVLDYAFGLAHGRHRGLPTIGHGGSDAGYRAGFVRYPEQRLAVISMCNAGPVNPGSFNERAAELYLAGSFREPAGPATPAAGVKLEADALAARVGVWWQPESDTFRKLAFDKEKAQLTSDSRALIAESETRFRLGSSTLNFQGPARLVVTTPGNAPSRYERVSEHKPTPRELAAYPGRYRPAELEIPYRVTLDGGGLVLARVLKGRPVKLQPMAKDVFTSDQGTVRFVRGTNGRITGMLLSSGRVWKLRMAREDSGVQLPRR